MAAALRPDGSAVDYFVVAVDGSTDHYLWTFQSEMWHQDNIGGHLLPHTLSAVWVGAELVVFGQAADGSFWRMVWDGSAWGTWKDTGAKGALPQPGPKGDPGAPGVPGPASTVIPPHTHVVTTSGTSGGPQ